MILYWINTQCLRGQKSNLASFFLKLKKNKYRKKTSTTTTAITFHTFTRTFNDHHNCFLRSQDVKTSHVSPKGGLHKLQFAACLYKTNYCCGLGRQRNFKDAASLYGSLDILLMSGYMHVHAGACVHVKLYLPPIPPPDPISPQSKH